MVRERGRVVAPGMEWVALTHAHERKQEPAEEAVRLEASHRISRARRLKPTDRPEPYGEGPLVEADQRNDEVSGDHSAGSFGAAVWVVAGVLARALRNESALAAMRRAAVRHSARSPASERDRTAWFLGITTTSIPPGKRAGECRNASRMSLFARLRRTASPNLRVTVIPSLGGWSSRRAARSRMQLGNAIREPPS